MTHQDPIDELTNYYQSLPQPTASDEMFAQILRSKGVRKRRAMSAATGFLVAVTAAMILLAWSAIPAKNDKSNANAIARYQMINSGLVEASDTKVQTR